MQNRVGKLQENALAEGITLPLALTNSKETPRPNRCQLETRVLPKRRITMVGPPGLEPGTNGL